MALVSGRSLRRHSFRIGHIDEIASDPQARQILGDERMGASVQAFLGQQMVSRLKHCQQGGRDCRHAAGGDDRRLGALQCRQQLGQGDMIGRVVQADIFKVFVFFLARVLKGRRLKDRSSHGAGETRMRIAGMNEFGLEFQDFPPRHTRLIKKS